MNQPGGFKFDFGSTVTILTTAAAGADHGKNVNSLGVFTGVVLDEAELKLKRPPKHVSISVDGIEQVHDGDYFDKPDTDKDDGLDKDGKDKDHDGLDKEDKDKDHDKWCKDDKDKDHDEKKHAIVVKKPDEFLVLSLTCASFPFTAGQLVWVNIEQIVALAVVCRN